MTAREISRAFLPGISPSSFRLAFWTVRISSGTRIRSATAVAARFSLSRAS